MNLSREDFDNPQVRAAQNPSVWGHFHGPIENNNEGWHPFPSERGRPVLASDNANPPNPPADLSAVNGLVCDITVNGMVMCGRTFSSQIALRRHCRDFHPGAITNRNTANTGQQEEIAGENALKLWVLSGGWRDARYHSEPSNLQPDSRLKIYADACESIARQDSDFAYEFGTQFNRRSLPPKPPKSKKRGRPATPSSQDAPSKRAAKHVQKKAARKGKTNARTRSQAVEIA